MAKDVNGWAWGRESSATTNSFVQDREERAKEHREYQDALIKIAVIKNERKHLYRRWSQDPSVINGQRFVAWSKAGCETLRCKPPRAVGEQWDFDDDSIPEGWPPGVDGQKVMADYMRKQGYPIDGDE